MKKMSMYAIAGMFLMTVILWVGVSAGSEEDMGKSLYANNCEICHGKNGDGKGPAAESFSPSPRDFTDPKFWQNDADEKITNTIENGIGVMPAFQLNSDQIKALIDYMSRSFKPAH